VLLVDHYTRRIPEHFKPYVTESYPGAEDMAVFSGSGRTDQRWRIVSDLNGEQYAHGTDALRRRFTAGQSRARERGDLYFGYCNFKEMEPGIAGFIRQACDGILEIYVKGKYQFLRVARSPNGGVSNEHLLMPIDNKPYIRLVQK